MFQQPIAESTNVVSNIPDFIKSVPIKAENIDFRKFFNFDPFDNTAITQLLPGGEELDFYLWVSHGSNVSSEQNFYPVETKFQSLIFYSKPYQFIDDTELVSFFTKRPCKMLTGSCPIIPVEQEDKKYAYLPPLVFYIQEGDTESLRNLMGLYHFTLKKTANQLISQTPQGELLEKQGYVEDECVFVKGEKVLNYMNFYRNYEYNNMTYSSIFKHVLDHCREKEISPENVMLGLYNCQSKLGKHISAYDQTKITNLIPRRVDTSYPPARIIPDVGLPMEKIIEQAGQIYIVPAIFEPPHQPNLTSWSGALAGISHQGCALNVFNFYGIMETTKAREQTVCLTSKGTSIFKVIDILNNEFIKIGVSLVYMVLRCTLEYGCNILLEYMRSPSNNGIESNRVVIFKLYKELEHEEGKYSQIGHTVSIYSLDNHLYYIDPQASKLQEITGSDDASLARYIKSLYNFNYIDIIFGVFSSPPTTYRSYNLYNILNIEEQPVIIERTQDINYGGKLKRNNKSKKINQSNKAKKNNRSNRSNKSNRSKKYSKSNKSLKNVNIKYKYKYKYKQHAGAKDPYIQMVQEIDKRNKVPSLIMEDDIIAPDTK